MQQVITAGQVLIGPARQRIRDGGVLVEDDTIVAVGDRREIEQQAGPAARHRHFPTTSTLLPGLINAHVHLCFDATPHFLENLIQADDLDLLPGMAGRAQQALGSGVTTVRDLGDRSGLAIRLRDAIARGDLPGPRILASAPPLTIRDGHCHFLGGAVSGEAEIQERVRQNAALGADVIKVMASGGQITPDSPPMWASQFTGAELAIIVEEAANHGLPVAAHAHGTESIAAATAAGVSTIEHCSWKGPDGPDRRDDVAKQMADKGIHACTALSRNWRALMERLGPAGTEEMYGRLVWLDELGVPLIIGTDAGLPGSVFDDLPGTMELFDHLGFPLDQVLDMVTTASADALGIGDRVGRIRPGYDADLIVVEGDPLARLDDLRNLRLVLARGREFQPPG
ncbi:amidohydrolase family protein [Saccharopolyspora sp. NPDC050642]|uniref:amidohydrolase family protein n=1 Tax=Saccharopolyspora sp. NPDC050642 TaxID=3157099 RepID=UPI0033C595C5